MLSTLIKRNFITTKLGY